MLNKSGEGGHLYMISNLRGNAFSFSPWSMMLGVNLSYMIFIMLCSFYAHLLERSFFLIINRYWICQMLSEIYWYDDVIFIVCFLNVGYHIKRFTDAKSTLHPWNKSHLIMVYDTFTILLNSVCEYFVENFCMCVLH